MARRPKSDQKPTPSEISAAGRKLLPEQRQAMRRKAWDELKSRLDADELNRMEHGREAHAIYQAVMDHPALALSLAESRGVRVSAEEVLAEMQPLTPPNLRDWKVRREVQRQRLQRVWDRRDQWLDEDARFDLLEEALAGFANRDREQHRQGLLNAIEDSRKKASSMRWAGQKAADAADQRAERDDWVRAQARLKWQSDRLRPIGEVAEEIEGELGRESFAAPPIGRGRIEQIIRSQRSR